MTGEEKCISIMTAALEIPMGLQKTRVAGNWKVQKAWEPCVTASRSLPAVVL